LYISVSFLEFYFPKTRALLDFPLKYLDDFNDLGNFNWAKAVHDKLVDSLSIASRKLKHSPTKIDLNGCVAVLNVWTCEHYSRPIGQRLRNSPGCCIGWKRHTSRTRT